MLYLLHCTLIITDIAYQFHSLFYLFYFAHFCIILYYFFGDCIVQSPCMITFCTVLMLQLLEFPLEGQIKDLLSRFSAKPIDDAVS